MKELNTVVAGDLSPGREILNLQDASCHRNS